MSVINAQPIFLIILASCPENFLHRILKLTFILGTKFAEVNSSLLIHLKQAIEEA